METNENNSKRSGDLFGISGQQILKDVELFQWEPMWNEYSIDPFCAKLFAYLKLVGIEFKVNNCNNPDISPTGSLPMLRIGEKMLGGSTIINYLNEQKFFLDHQLTPLQLADIDAYTSLVEDKLHKSLLWNCWMEPENFESVRYSYASRMVFPLNYIVPRTTRNKISKELKSLNYTKEKAYQIAAKGYQALATRLDNSKFFFGDNPTSLDLTVFGHLTCVLNFNLPVSTLKDIVKGHIVLVEFEKRITLLLQNASFKFDTTNVVPPKPSFFASTVKSQPPKEKTAEEKKSEEISLFFAAGAIALMFAYVTRQYLIEQREKEELDKKK